MFRRSRTREPTWRSIGLGLSPFWRPVSRVCWCIAIFGRLHSQRHRSEMTNYTIIGDEQPGSTENKHFLRSQVSARGLPEGPRRGLQRSRNAIPFDLERDID